MTKDQLTEPAAAVRLWVHECERVLADRLINTTDLNKFSDMRVNATKKFFEDTPKVQSRSAADVCHISPPCLEACVSVALREIARDWSETVCE